MRILLHRSVCACWALSAGLWCAHLDVGASPLNHSQGTEAFVRPQNSVRSIILPHFEPELAMVPGRNEYLAVCVSCHSPRYVSMQPFFSQRQWEETVDKMVKVYGAQMDPEQRAAIVQFLVATHGPEAARAPAQDEDSDFAPVAKPSSRPETAPLLSLAADTADHLKQVERGAELFKNDCAACHGATGRGDGFIASVLLHKPKNLAAARFSVILLSQALWNGKPGTAMPSWRGLQQTDLAALAAYVMSLHQPGQSELVSKEALKDGSQLFQKNCAQCHGASGDGNGPVATNLLPEPANFQLKQPDFEYIVEVLKQGIPGTAMPSWEDQISDADRRALASFVRSVFESANSKSN